MSRFSEQYHFNKCSQLALNIFTYFRSVMVERSTKIKTTKTKSRQKSPNPKPNCQKSPKQKADIQGLG